jgi:hypothetical protein
MSHPTLQRGDRGEDVARLQSQQGRSDALCRRGFRSGDPERVLYAQDVARQPATGIADAALWEWVEGQPEPSDLLHRDGIAFT